MSKVNLILDEATNLGSMRTIDEVLTLYRGYGIGVQLYYQSLAQLKKCFPNGQDQTVLANVTQVFFAVNDMSAEYISNRIGDQTIVVDSGSTSSGISSPSDIGAKGHSTYSQNTTRGWSKLGRKLLKTEEILSMDPRLAVTFVAGQKPILTRLERYYEKPERRDFSWSDALLFSLFIFTATTNCFLEALNLLKG